MKISTSEYCIVNTETGLDIICLHAKRKKDDLEIGKLSLKILSTPPQTAQLSKICTHYPKTLWPPQARDYGGNGIATKLLLQGAHLLHERSIVYLTGIFAPEKDFYQTKD